MSPKLFMIVKLTEHLHEKTVICRWKSTHPLKLLIPLLSQSLGYCYGNHNNSFSFLNTHTENNTITKPPSLVVCDYQLLFVPNITLWIREQMFSYWKVLKMTKENDKGNLCSYSDAEILLDHAASQRPRYIKILHSSQLFTFNKHHMASSWCVDSNQTEHDLLFFFFLTSSDSFSFLCKYLLAF